MGFITSLSKNAEQTIRSIESGKSGFKPLGLFPWPESQVPLAGEVSIPNDTAYPRTHLLASLAIDEMTHFAGLQPDAIVVGVTTGGMSRTESLLADQNSDNRSYQFHSPATIAEMLARRFSCTGPVITVSTACSSGAVAIKVALELLASQMADTVLTGGVDGLCRLTYYGFDALQLIDPMGARPFDKHRRGMTLSDGAAFLLLTREKEFEKRQAAAKILGAGLACDAYHATSPHPEGDGAFRSMTEALNDAGADPLQVDYINTHGTGTVDNDLSEARAIRRLFGKHVPPFSSIKGATGHSLAAAGAIEAAISGLCVSKGLILPNVGFSTPDDDIGIIPESVARKKKLNIVLSNSFGFGGNNASVVIGSPDLKISSSIKKKKAWDLEIVGAACLTGAGGLTETIDTLTHSGYCGGMLSDRDVCRRLPFRDIRRLKRLSRMALSLADSALSSMTGDHAPRSLILGTGWGGLSETYDFLSALLQLDSSNRYHSPIDFIGSVHNAPAGQVAIRYGIQGANITTVGGDASFEQALLTARLLTATPDRMVMVMGLDEYHHVLSPRLDRSIAGNENPADGGGALCIVPRAAGSKGVFIDIPAFYFSAGGDEHKMDRLVNDLGGRDRICSRYEIVFVGLNETDNRQCYRLDQFRRISEFQGEICEYRPFTGRFASASAVMTALAAHFVRQGKIPHGMRCARNAPLVHRGVLILGLGDYISAIEIMPGQG